MQKAIIITAPSGAGKTTLVQKLIATRSDLEFSISACTREKRAGEIHGKDYYFLHPSVFKEMIQKDEFIEWEEVYDNMFYGTLKSEIKRIWANNKAVIFDIDVQGALTLKNQLGSKALSIFIAPPNLEILKQRLQSRGTESEESLNKRYNKAVHELAFKDHMDEIVVNDDLEQAFKDLNEKIQQFLS